MESVDFVFQLPDYVDPGLTPDLGLSRGGARTYTTPSPSENPLNAWMHRVRTSFHYYLLPAHFTSTPDIYHLAFTVPVD